MTEEFGRKRERDGRGAQLVPNKSGFVYFIQCGEAGGPIKIGKAGNADERLLDLQVGCPFDLQMLAALLVDEPADLEAELHRRYSEFRIRGEWFEGSHAVRSGAAQTAKLAARQREQLKSAGPPVFEWRGVVRESIEMPDPAVLVSVPVGSRHADPRKLRAAGNGFAWRGRWRRD